MEHLQPRHVKRTANLFSYTVTGKAWHDRNDTVNHGHGPVFILEMLTEAAFLNGRPSMLHVHGGV